MTTIGTRSATGTAGTNGGQGATGATGTQGATGSAGSNGGQGATGATGATGSQGTTGTQGATGATGSAGSAGSQGATGATGAGISTSSNTQLNSLGVNTAASGTAGEIRATNNITAYYSDDRLKTRLGPITNALDKLRTLNGFYYEANEVAQELGYTVRKEVGVSAQEVQGVLPEIVVPAPIDDRYLTVHYERIIPLLIEAIKELEEKLNGNIR